MSHLPSDTSKVFLPKSIWNELPKNVKKLIIVHNKNDDSSSPHSPATQSPTSHMTPIGTKPVINCQVKVHEIEEMSESPSTDPTTEDLHQDPLLTMVHDSQSQPEISNSSDIAQLLSINKSTTRHIAKVHRQ